MTASRTLRWACGAVGLLAAVGLAVVVGSRPASGGDRLGAEAAVAKGRAALRAKKPAEAESACKEALHLDATYVPARVLLAEALLLGGAKGAALETLRVVVETIEADGSARLIWAKDLARARDLLKTHDADGRALEKAIDDYVAALLRIARSALDAEPDLARDLVQRARALRPSRHELGPLALRLGLLEPGAPLFDGASATGWMWLDPPSWTIEDGAAVGVAADVYAVARTVVAVSGDYDVRCEARVLEGGSTVLLLQGGWNEFAQNVSLGAMGSGVLLVDGATMAATNDPPRAKPLKTRTPFDPRAWNHFELRFRADRVTGYVNGEEVGSLARPGHAKSGHVALAVLQGKAAFRGIEVLRR